jgi:hypothetical protein
MIGAMLIGDDQEKIRALAHGVVLLSSK